LSQVLETLDNVHKGARIVHRYIVPESITQILTPNRYPYPEVHTAHIVDWAYAEVKDELGGELTPPITFSTSFRFLQNGGDKYEYVDDFIAVAQVFLLQLRKRRPEPYSLKPSKNEVVSFWTKVIEYGGKAAKLFATAKEQNIRSMLDIMKTYAIGASFPLVRLLEF
jgi:hypothetical protein